MSLTGQNLLDQQRLTTVYVWRSGVGQPCRAKPGTASGRKANPDFIRWVNYTGGNITVHLPAGAVSNADVELPPIPNGSASSFISVAAGTPGFYEYQIVCDATPGVDAIADSSPVIIIE